MGKENRKAVYLLEGRCTSNRRTVTIPSKHITFLTATWVFHKGELLFSFISYISRRKTETTSKKLNPYTPSTCLDYFSRVFVSTKRRFVFCSNAEPLGYEFPYYKLGHEVNHFLVGDWGCLQLTYIPTHLNLNLNS